MDCSTSGFPVPHHFPEFVQVMSISLVMPSSYPWGGCVTAHYLAIRKNAFTSVLMRWINLEPIVQGEVSQNETNILIINTYTWNLKRWYWWSYTQERIWDTDMKNRLLNSVGEGEGRMIWENSTETYILPYVKQAVSGDLLSDTDSTQCSVTTWRGGRWEGGARGRRYMNPSDWFLLIYDRNQYNTVKQLSSNKKFKKKKT